MYLNIKMTDQIHSSDNDLRTAFNEFSDENGKISIKELTRVLTELGEILSEEEAEETINMARDNGCIDENDNIDIDKFVQVIIDSTPE